jgi:ubiquitin-protein ligase
MEEEEAKGIRLAKFRVLKEIRQVREQYDRQMLAQKQAGSHPPNIPDGLTLFFSPADLVDGNELHVQWTMQVHKSEIPDSYWPNCRFTFDALFPEHYPAEMPKVTCKTPIFHPNISPSGSVDHYMLHSGWRPNITLFDVIERIFVDLVQDPNFNDPLPESQEAGELGLSDKEEFRRRAMALARQHKTFIPGTCPPPSRSMFL